MSAFPSQIVRDEARKACISYERVISPWRAKRADCPLRLLRFKIIMTLHERGLSTQQIGRAMHRDPSTIGYHIRRIKNGFIPKTR